MTKTKIKTCTVFYSTRSRLQFARFLHDQKEWIVSAVMSVFCYGCVIKVLIWRVPHTPISAIYFIQNHILHSF